MSDLLSESVRRRLMQLGIASETCTSGGLSGIISQQVAKPADDASLEDLAWLVLDLHARGILDLPPGGHLPR